MGYYYNLDNQSNLDSTEVIGALKYATRMHGKQIRRNGKEYISHPTNVANLVRFFFYSQFNDSSFDLDTLLMASYLHDTLEDTQATFKELVEKFGPDVAFMVHELTTDKDLKNEIGKAKYLSIKMKNMSGQALMIKLCDRLDNTSDLMEQTEEFRTRYIKETCFILYYILQNRNLNRIHLAIIACIIEQLCLIKTSNISFTKLRQLVRLPQ